MNNREEIMEFRSRAVRSLVELHEREMQSFLEVWKRFVAANLPMPEAHGDESYEDRERLAGHVLMAARGYLIRIGEWVGRPVTDLDASQDPYEIVKRAPEFGDAVLGAYRRHLSEVTDQEMDQQVHRTRLGNLMSVEMLLEHAVVHPMRHRIQLERILESREAMKA
jgi:uncharacterized damage-inducible protein DinB